MNILFNKNFIILSLTAVLLILMFLFMIVSNLPQKTQTNIYPQISPTSYPRSSKPLPPIPAQGEDYKKSAQKIAVNENPIIDKDAIVGQLLTKLPYKGTNFRIENDYQKAQMIVTINKDKQAEGNMEFDEYLRMNGIENKDWIRNLVIKYE